MVSRARHLDLALEREGHENHAVASPRTCRRLSARRLRLERIQVLHEHYGNTGPLTTVMRPDGKGQAAAAGQPLYTYAGDSKAGDTNGQGIGGIWFVIKAQGA